MGIVDDEEALERERDNDPWRGAARGRQDEHGDAAVGELLVGEVDGKVELEVLEYLLADVVYEVHDEEDEVGNGERDQIGAERGARQLGAAEDLEREGVADDADEAYEYGYVDAHFGNELARVRAQCECGRGGR